MGGLPSILLIFRYTCNTFNNTSFGYKLTFFGQEQAGPLKPSPKLRGPGCGGKLNSFQHHCQAFALLITLKICIPLIIYHINRIFGISGMKICKFLKASVRFDKASYLYTTLFSGASWVSQHLVLGDPKH